VLHGMLLETIWYLALRPASHVASCAWCIACRYILDAYDTHIPHAYDRPSRYSTCLPLSEKGALQHSTFSEKANFRI